MRNPKLVTVFTKARHWTYPVSYFNTNLSVKLISLSVISLKFSDKNLLCISHFPMRATCPHIVFFDSLDVITYYRLMSNKYDAINCDFSPGTFSLEPKYSPQQGFQKSSVHINLSEKKISFAIIKTTGKFIILLNLFVTLLDG
jgi:hypothetical protein